MYYYNSTWIVYETMHFKCTLICSILDLTSETVRVYIKRWIKSYLFLLKDFSYKIFHCYNYTIKDFILWNYILHEHVYNQTSTKCFGRCKGEMKIFFYRILFIKLKNYFYFHLYMQYTVEYCWCLLYINL